MKTIDKNNKSIFLFSILSIIIVLFAGFSILVPKISPRLFEARRQLLWESFNKNLKSRQVIDVKEFWKFREFYSPGSFTFNRNGLKENDRSVSISNINLLRSNNEYLIFLKYESGKVESTDILTTVKSLDSYLKNSQIKKMKVISQGRNYVLLKQDTKNDILIFLVDEAEMESANGFFDFREKDKELVKGKYWLDISLIRLD